MIKKFLLVLSFLASTGNAATFDDMPEIIDFTSFKGNVEDSNYEPVAWSLGYAALNYAPELNGIFSILKRDYKVNTVVETGTHRGASTRLFAILFDEVHTIEILESSYTLCKNALKKDTNVKCHLGSSETVLQKLLPTLKDKSVLFYLDAHWNDHWPLRQEIEVIGKTHFDNCIIVIDDFKVPGRSDLLFDHYGRHECSYEYIADKLHEVYSDYKMFYVIPRAVSSRAKLVLMPKVWNRKK